MPKYRVYLAAVAETSVDVEADDGEAAVEKAFDEAEYPFFPAGMKGDLGEWNTLSELFPQRMKPEDDYLEIEE